MNQPYGETPCAYEYLLLMQQHITAAAFPKVLPGTIVPKRTELLIERPVMPQRENLNALRVIAQTVLTHNPIASVWRPIKTRHAKQESRYEETNPQPCVRCAAANIGISWQTEIAIVNIPVADS